MTNQAMTCTVPAQTYPEHTPLRLPERHPDYPRYQSLLRLERRLFGDWLQWLTNSWCATSTVRQHVLRCLCASAILQIHSYRARLIFDVSFRFCTPVSAAAHSNEKDALGMIKNVTSAGVTTATGSSSWQRWTRWRRRWATTRVPGSCRTTALSTSPSCRSWSASSPASPTTRCPRAARAYARDTLDRHSFGWHTGQLNGAAGIRQHASKLLTVDEMQ